MKFFFPSTAAALFMLSTNNFAMADCDSARFSVSCKSGCSAPSSSNLVIDDHLCNEKLETVYVKYTGATCDASTHGQEDVDSGCVDQDPKVDTLDEVIVELSDNREYTVHRGVKPGDIIGLTNARQIDTFHMWVYENEDKLKAFDDIQDAWINTGCDQVDRPFKIGDQIGAFQIVGWHHLDDGEQFIRADAVQIEEDMKLNFGLTNAKGFDEDTFDLKVLLENDSDGIDLSSTATDKYSSRRGRFSFTKTIPKEELSVADFEGGIMVEIFGDLDGEHCPLFHLVEFA